jgi:hypothetical protein
MLSYIYIINILCMLPKLTRNWISMQPGEVLKKDKFGDNIYDIFGMISEK